MMIFSPVSFWGFLEALEGRAERFCAVLALAGLFNLLAFWGPVGFFALLEDNF